MEATNKVARKAATSGVCSRALRVACEHGHHLVVSELLADSRIDPSAEESLAIRVAARSGHVAVVGRLLADGRTYAGACDDEALRAACKAGHTDVVTELLASSRVDPAASNGDALRVAVQQGHAVVVTQLLAHERVNPAADDNAAIQDAAKRGYAPVVAVLLAHPRVDPTANDNVALQKAGNRMFWAPWAPRDGQLEVLRCLLGDERVYATASADLLHAALLVAAKYADRPLVDCLLREPRLNSMLTADFSPVLWSASRNGKLDHMEWLLQDPRCKLDDKESEELIHGVVDSGRYASLVAMLLQHRHFTVALKSPKQLLRAANDSGRAPIVLAVLTALRGRELPNGSIEDAMYVAGENGDVAAMMELLREYGNGADRDALLRSALDGASNDGYTTGKRHLVITTVLREPAMLCPPPAQTSFFFGAALLAAIAADDVAAVEDILSKDPVDFKGSANTPYTGNDSFCRHVASKTLGTAALLQAMESNRLEIVDRLLRDPRLDLPGDVIAGCLKGTIRYSGRSCVGVARVVQDPRMDFSDCGDELARLAARNGHNEVVDALLRHRSFHADPAAAAEGQLIRAAEAGDLRSVERLLADARVNPAADDNASLSAAVGAGHATVMERLLLDPRVDASITRMHASLSKFALAYRAQCSFDSVNTPVHRALHKAMRAGHVDVVDKLAADPRIWDAACTETCAYAWAPVAVVDRLLATGRLPAQVVSADTIARCASQWKWDAIERLLEADQDVSDRAPQQFGAVLASELKRLQHRGPFGRLTVHQLADCEVLPDAAKGILTRNVDTLLYHLGAATWRRRRAAVLGYFADPEE